MKRNSILRTLLTGFIFMSHPFTGAANNGNPYPHSGWQPIIVIKAAADSVPDNKKNPAEIKEVPKSKKQDLPIAVVPIAIKPVSIKPKVIIKPVIKIH